MLTHTKLSANSYTTDVPTCLMQAPDEVLYMPPKILAMKYTNIQRVTVPAEGGHFMPLENPKVFAKDMVSAMRLFADYHNDVKYDSGFDRCL